MGFLFAAMGPGFVALGVFVMRDAGFFRYLWIAFSSFFVLVGLGILVTGIRQHGITRRITADSRLVRIRTLKRGMPVDEQSLDRDEVVAVRWHKSGSVNGRPAFGLELVGVHTSVRLATFCASEELPVVARELAGKLGVPGNGG